MAEEMLDKDTVIRRASKELGVDENVVRQFVDRNDIDAVALFDEKRQVMERKARRGGRLVLGVAPAAVRDLTIRGEVRS